MHQSVTLSIRVSPEIRDQLDDLASSTGRTKSFLAADALQHYLELHSWQVQTIKKAVDLADSKNAKFVEHEKVVEWLNSWGEDGELDPPK